MANYNLSHRFSIQSELIFDASNSRYVKLIYYTGSNGNMDFAVNDFSIKMRYLEMPVLGKISFGRKVTFDLIGGGFISYLLSAKQSTYSDKLYLPEDVEYFPQYYVQKTIDYPPHDVRPDYLAFNAGVLAGCGMTVRDILVFELRVNCGMVNINKVDASKMHTIQGQFTVGYYIFRQKKKQ